MRGLIFYYVHLKKCNAVVGSRTKPNFFQASQPKKLCTKYVETGTKWPRVLELNPAPKNGPIEPSCIPAD